MWPIVSLSQIYLSKSKVYGAKKLLLKYISLKKVTRVNVTLYYPPLATSGNYTTLKVHMKTSVQRIMSPHCFYLDLKSQLHSLVFLYFPIYIN